MKNEISVSTFWRCGGRLINRDALPHDHPEQTYNYIKTNFNVDPGKYGVKHPLMAEFEDKSRSELIDEIALLRKENESLHKACAMFF